MRQKNQKKIMQRLIVMAMLFLQASLFAIECDFTGNWSNGGAIFQLSQSGKTINFTYNNSGFNHNGTGVYNSADNSFVIRQNRIDKSNGCSTQANLTFKVKSCRELSVVSVFDGGCGLPAGYKEGPSTCIKQ